MSLRPKPLKTPPTFSHRVRELARVYQGQHEGRAEELLAAVEASDLAWLEWTNRHYDEFIVDEWTQAVLDTAKITRGLFEKAEAEHSYYLRLGARHP